MVCGQKTVRAAAGDLVVINPGALHAIYQAEEDPAPAVYHCLIIDKSFCDANRIRLSGMWFTERLRSPEAASLMLAIARETAEKREFYKLQVQSLAVSLLIRLCREAPRRPPAGGAGTAGQNPDGQGRHGIHAGAFRRSPHH